MNSEAKREISDAQEAEELERVFSRFVSRVSRMQRIWDGRQEGGLEALNHEAGKLLHGGVGAERLVELINNAYFGLKWRREDEQRAADRSRRSGPPR